MNIFAQLLTTFSVVYFQAIRFLRPTAHRVYTKKVTCIISQEREIKRFLLLDISFFKS
jgi:hypothetical protein